MLEVMFQNTGINSHVGNSTQTNSIFQPISAAYHFNGKKLFELVITDEDKEKEKSVIFWALD